MSGRTGAQSVLTVQADTVLVLSPADARMLGELLQVAQATILQTVAAAASRPVSPASSMLDTLRSWASMAADLRERVIGGGS